MPTAGLPDANVSCRLLLIVIIILTHLKDKVRLGALFLTREQPESLRQTFGKLPSVVLESRTYSCQKLGADENKMAATGAISQRYRKKVRENAM